MKKIYLLSVLICLSFLSSCVDDSRNPGVNNPPPVFSYDETEASFCMTLASLSYTAENNPAYVRDSLILQLKNNNYATGGDWKLDWGPALSSQNGNMMYVAKDTTVTPAAYCIAIRGTDWCFPYDWEEDIGAIEFVRYPWGTSEDSVSYGALFGLDSLLIMRDSATGKTLAQYLNGFSDSTNQMYITGHSLGGMLATMLSAWFIDNGYTSRFSLNTYTFAAPSCGNAQFAQHIAQKISATNSEFYRVVNPNDLVHYFYGDISTVIVNQIPTSIPYSIDAVLFAMDVYFTKYNLIYQHVGTKVELNGPTTPVPCNFPSGSLENYECWVAFEHTTSTYLYLLNAPITNTGNTPCKWKNP